MLKDNIGDSIGDYDSQLNNEIYGNLEDENFDKAENYN